ncbi:hypothetical protein [Rheinheimera gaetbuli]
MNKKKFLWLFVLCSALPLLAAKLVLEFGWFNRGVSSHGQWQQAEVFLLAATAEKAHWRVGVIPADECAAQCLAALHTVQQLYVGLGRKQAQVQPVFISTQQAATEFTAFTQQPAISAVPPELHNKILLIDQQGLVLLSYPMPAASADMAGTAKAIRQDLLKLLNYDRTSV